MAFSTPQLLDLLADWLQTRFGDVCIHATRIEARMDTRYREIDLCFEYDESVRSIRMYTLLPPPAGGGKDFLTWCLSMNVTYWDVKIGVAEDGMLVLHADVDVDSDDAEQVAARLFERAAALEELLDEDFIPYLLERDLVTPQQRRRWQPRMPE